MIAYTVILVGPAHKLSGDFALSTVLSVTNGVVPDHAGGMEMDLPQLPAGGSLRIEFTEIPE